MFNDDLKTKVWKFIYCSIWSGNASLLNEYLEKIGMIGKAAIFEGMTPRFINMTESDDFKDFLSINPDSIERLDCHKAHFGNENWPI